jgi:hypothetical protein
MREELTRLVFARGDVRLLHLLLGDGRIFEWAHATGVLTEPALAATVPPIPPDHLRNIVAEPPSRHR